MSENKGNKSWLDQLPFPRHWLGYIALKILAVALLIYLALRWRGLV